MFPRFAMVADLILATILVNVFRNWSLLATVITGSTLIAYLTGPVTVISLRKMAPELKRPFAPNYMKWLAPFAFVVTGLAIYWTMWPTTVQVIFVIALGLPIYLYYEWRYQKTNWRQQLRSAAWLICYMIFISLISYAGSEGFGGQNWIPYPFDLSYSFSFVILFTRGFCID